MAIAVLFFGLVVSQAAPSGASHPDCTDVSLADQGGVLVPVMLNGMGPFRLLLDTGATHSSVSADVAHAIGARVVATTTVTTSTVTRPLVLQAFSRTLSRTSRQRVLGRLSWASCIRLVSR